MSSKTIIFKRLQQALQRTHLDEDTLQTLEARLANPPIHTQPTFINTLFVQFTTALAKVATTCTQVTQLEAIPQAILSYTQQCALQLVIDKHLDHLNWPSEITTVCRPAQATDTISVSQAFAGVAETGSVVLLSTSPTSLNFLPATHIIIVYQADIVAKLEDVWKRLRDSTIPRVVNLITGPSRTADIEQTIQIGAHGPKRLHVIIVKNGSLLDLIPQVK